MNSWDPVAYAETLRSAKIDEFTPIRLFIYNPMLTLEEYAALGPC